MKTGHAGNGKQTRRAATGAQPARTGGTASAGADAQPLARTACVSLCGRPGTGESRPIFAANQPVMDRLTSGALPRMAAALAPVLPVGLLGIDVREPLHRFDANAHAPGLERGVSGANRVGEPLGTLAMRWRLVPDGFEATPGSTPPDTEVRSGHSQRFVMQDGVITFQE